jgi:cysteinyl-tRNA synthetase
MMRLLIDGGHAYLAAGSVWFDVGRFAGYGELSGQRPEAMQPSAETEPGKRDPRDFALWKAAKPGEPVWNTPWGPGRPGWHLECSAMAAKYLGHPFDIHGAGVDLVFPHNENERAQSICAFGALHGEMARWWLHNGLVTLNREKMSKSTGNVFAADEALAQVRPQVLRLHLSAAHYRSSLDYSEEGLAESAAAYERLETFVRNAADLLGENSPAAAAGPWDSPWESFAAAMDDDIGVPRALAAAYGAVSRGNAVLSRDSAAELAGWLAVVQRMLGVLGLDPLTQWPVGADDGRLATVLDTLVRVREEARRRRDFTTSDALRDAFAAAGVAVEDTPHGPRWRLG